MGLIIQIVARGLRAAAAAMMSACLLAACSSSPPQIPPAEQPLSKETLMLLGKKGMDPTAPIFVRIFKEESELEVWKLRPDGHFYHFKTYPICNWSGELGPKQQYGDRQAPEGFYTVSGRQLNPNSQFYLAFNLGYPNSFDRAHKRTGDALMVHGNCRSAGCYAMTDALIEEIYAIAREALKGGQESFQVHAFPFRMTDANLARHTKNQWYPFWLTLKQGYDVFETSRIPPTVAVCERRYIVNVKLPSSGRLDAESACPPLQHLKLEPFVPKPSEQQIAEERISARGPKMRAIASAGNVAGEGDQSAGATTTGSLGIAFGLGATAASGPALGFNR